MGWLASLVFDVNVELGCTLCISVLLIALLLIVGNWIWQWLSRRRAGASNQVSAHKGLVFGLVIWVVLLMPIPVVIIEAVIWQGWVEPSQRTQVRADGDRLVLAITAYRDRTGRYPSTLDALVPIEIDHVPSQPDGSPFVYVVSDTEYTLWYRLPGRGLSSTACSYSPKEGGDRWKCND